MDSELTKRISRARMPDGTEAGQVVTYHDQKGRLVEYTRYDDSGQELYHHELTHHDSPRGRETTVRKFGADGSPHETDFSKYDPRGELLETVAFDADWRLLDRQLYTYTDDTMHYRRFDGTGKIVENWTRRMTKPVKKGNA
jgi:hypothetical protein